MQNVAAALEEMRLGQEPRMGGTHKNKRQQAERRPRTGAGDGLTPTGCAQMVPDEGGRSGSVLTFETFNRA